MARLKWLFGILLPVSVVFLMSHNVSATSIDFSNSNNFYLAGFCANHATYTDGLLSYAPYNISGYDFDYSRSFTDRGYNQIQFDSSPCSDPWGITDVMLDWSDNQFGQIQDGQYINIDIVSNNYAFPFYEGATVGGYDNGIPKPAYIDGRTYDVQLNYDSNSHNSLRDITGAIYSHKFDEVELSSQLTSLVHHIQYSAPYIRSDYGNNGLGSIHIGTYTYFNNQLQWFAETSTSPFFFIWDYNYRPTMLFYVKIDITDEPLYSESGSVEENWQSEMSDYYNNEYSAVDEITNQSPSDLDVGNSATATNLIGYITNFIGYIGNISPASDCNITLNFPSYAGGDMVFNLCQFKDNFGSIITVFSSLVLITFYIPLAYKMLSVIYSEIRSFTNG